MTSHVARRWWVPLWGCEDSPTGHRAPRQISLQPAEMWQPQDAGQAQATSLLPTSLLLTAAIAHACQRAHFAKLQVHPRLSLGTQKGFWQALEPGRGSLVEMGLCKAPARNWDPETNCPSRGCSSRPITFRGALTPGQNALPARDELHSNPFGSHFHKRNNLVQATLVTTFSRNLHGQ